MSLKLLRNVTKSRKILLLNHVQARTIFSERFLRLDLFKEDQLRFQKKYGDTKADIKAMLSYQFNTETEYKVNVNHFVKLLRLSTNQKDFEYYAEHLKTAIQRNFISKGEIRGMVLEFIRLLYIYDSIDMAMSFYSDEIFKPYVNGEYATLFVLNKLLVDKRFAEAVDLFEQQIPFYKMTTSFSSKVPIHFRQSLPPDQLDCYVEALLNLNTKKEFYKLKRLFELLEEKKSRLGRTALARAFYMSIQQNEPEFALKLVHATPAMLDLKLNLEIIALARMGALNKALLTAQHFFELTCVRKHNMTGKFFPLTIKTLEEAIETSEHMIAYKKLLMELNDRIRNEQRIAHIDLREICFQN